MRVANDSLVDGFSNNAYLLKIKTAFGAVFTFK